MNSTRRVDDLEKWDAAESFLRQSGFSLWQFQYDIDSPHGFHGRFMNEKGWNIEIVTFNESVRDRVIKFNSKKD